MKSPKWIMSEGGPLIAVERELQAFWGGICRLTVATPGAASDYDRPPEALNYIQPIDLEYGKGLIFGEGPVDTTFWQEPDRQLHIVRTIFCDPDFEVNKMMLSLDQALFENPVEQIDFTFFSGNIVIFDSADDGSYHDVKKIEANISPGEYKISTILHEPNARSCSIIHNIRKRK